MLRVLAPTALLALALPAPAQIVYDAGTPGTPPVAPSPTTQGWGEMVTGNCTVTDVSPDPDFPLNAWQINDPGMGRVRYFQPLVPGLANYEVEIVMRPLAERIYVEIDAGTLITDNLFKIELRLVGPDVHITELGSGTTLICPGGVSGYHTYHFISGHSWNIAQVRYDGVYIGDLPYTTFGLGANGSGLR